MKRAFKKALFNFAIIINGRRSGNGETKKISQSLEKGLTKESKFGIL